MAASIKHKFFCPVPDDPDPESIRPSNWNDEHEISGVVLAIEGATPDDEGNVSLPFATDLSLIYQIAKL